MISDSLSLFARILAIAVIGVPLAALPAAAASMTDTTVPTVHIDGSTSIFNATSAHIEASISDPDDADAALSVSCVLDNTAPQPCNFPLDLSGLGDGVGWGQHSLIVLATDAAGNVGRTMARWLPEGTSIFAIPNVPATYTRETSTTVEWKLTSTTNDPSSYSFMCAAAGAPTPTPCTSPLTLSNPIASNNGVTIYVVEPDATQDSGFGLSWARLATGWSIISGLIRTSDNLPVGAGVAMRSSDGLASGGGATDNAGYYQAAVPTTSVAVDVNGAVNGPDGWVGNPAFDLRYNDTIAGDSTRSYTLPATVTLGLHATAEGTSGIAVSAALASSDPVSLWPGGPPLSMTQSGHCANDGTGNCSLLMFPSTGATSVTASHQVGGGMLYAYVNGLQVPASKDLTFALGTVTNITYTPPSEPTAVTAVAGASTSPSLQPSSATQRSLLVASTTSVYSATVTWKPPASNGNKQIDKYLIIAQPSGSTTEVPGDSTSAVVTGLPISVKSTFSVVAVNVIGTGAASQPSAAVVDDAVPPTMTTSSTPAFTLGTTVGLHFTGTDPGSGVSSYDIRYRRAPFNGAFGAYVTPTSSPDWTATTATTATLTAAKGYTYCLSARARDKVGNLSGWSAERCTATPLDDRSLVASSGWVNGTSTAFYASTYRRAVSTGRTLTRTGVQAKRFAVVATTCSGCGSVGVYWNGRLIKSISLNASTTHYRQVINVAAFSAVSSGTVVIKTLNNSRVYIDGLATSRS